jgi:GTP pyrophosphokinase
MVSAQHNSPLLSNQDSTDIQHWLVALMDIYTSDEIEIIRQACEFSTPHYHGETSISGTPLLQHAFGAASILVGLHLDYETIAATVLHAIPNHLDSWREKVTARFGRNISSLVSGMVDMERLRQFSKIRATPMQDKEEAAHQVEGLRKMLLAMVEDIRVVLIKLAERTQTLRTLSAATPENQRQVAQETRLIFAPLANRLGVWQIKWELEDLSLRYLEPILYKKVAKLLAEKRIDRELYIEDVVNQLKQTLTAAGVVTEVNGRPKHIYSIIAKMRRKRLDFSELYDVRAIRVLVNSIEDCYAALSFVHELWSPIESEFDDYIAHPKLNGYRSLHTAVVGPNDLVFEVQIRTREMHHDSELGVAAHWRYKENKRAESTLDNKISWLRKILEWKSELADSNELNTQFNNDLLQDRIYVFTPQGKVIDLANGSTPIDFAYTVHTELGHRTRGAKVDGRIVPLNTKLKTGQRVAILSHKQGKPSRDWLSPKLGFLQSTRARAKVRNWFSTQNLDVNIAQGKILLDRELHRVGVSDINQEKLAQKLNFNRPNDLLAALGRSDITPNRVGLAISQNKPSTSQRKPAPSVQKTNTQQVLIGDVNNLEFRIAKCCKPNKTDIIIGYVTRDRGITIHRKDCAFMQRVPEVRKDRMLDARWAE